MRKLLVIYETMNGGKPFELRKNYAAVEMCDIVREKRHILFKVNRSLHRLNPPTLDRKWVAYEKQQKIIQFNATKS